uniref:ATP synthase subunit s, mitochondrial n=1 Tax=Rhabditophanes sp. KR3021 TaxID=114890 RepID=A0AC35TK35_9BILA
MIRPHLLSHHLKIFEQSYRHTGNASFRFTGIRRQLVERISNQYKVERVAVLGPDLACLEWLMNCGASQVSLSDGSVITSISQMKAFLKNAGFDLSNLPKANEYVLSYLTNARNSNKNNLKQLSTYATRELRSRMRKQEEFSRTSEISYQERWAHVPDVHIVKVDASDSVIADNGFKYFHHCNNISGMKLNFCDYFGNDAIKEIALGRPSHTLKDLEIVLNPSISDSVVYWLVKLEALQRAHFYFLPYISNRPSIIRQLKLALPRCRVTFPETDKVGYGYE